MNIESDSNGNILFFEYRLQEFSDKYCIVAYSPSKREVLGQFFPNLS